MLTQGMENAARWAIAASQIGVLQVILLLFALTCWAAGTKDPLSRRFLRSMRRSFAALAYDALVSLAHVSYKLRRAWRKATWHIACQLVTGILAIDRAVTIIGLNLLAHETWNRAQMRKYQRASKTRVERRCQRKLAREKQCEKELAELICKAKAM